MTDNHAFWLFISICALVSAVCRLLPLMINVEALPGSARAVITRLAKYISVVLLVTILAGTLWQLKEVKGLDIRWLLPVFLAWGLSATTSLKSWHVFALSLGVWGVLS